jgi:hypothetical protein
MYTHTFGIPVLFSIDNKGCDSIILEKKMNLADDWEIENDLK